MAICDLILSREVALSLKFFSRDMAKLKSHIAEAFFGINNWTVQYLVQSKLKPFYHEYEDECELARTSMFKYDHYGDALYASHCSTLSKSQYVN